MVRPSRCRLTTASPGPCDSPGVSLLSMGASCFARVHLPPQLLPGLGNFGTAPISGQCGGHGLGALHRVRYIAPSCAAPALPTDSAPPHSDLYCRAPLRRRRVRDERRNWISKILRVSREHGAAGTAPSSGSASSKRIGGQSPPRP